MRRLPEKDPPRKRKVIKNTNQNYLSWLLGIEVPGRGKYLPLKSNEIKYFYELVKEETHEKSLKIIMQEKSKKRNGLPSIIFSILWFKFNTMESTLNFRAVISYQILFSVCCCFQFSPALYASNNLSPWNNTPCVRMYYCATSLRNHRLFLIPQFEL